MTDSKGHRQSILSSQVSKSYDLRKLETHQRPFPDNYDHPRVLGVPTVPDSMHLTQPTAATLKGNRDFRFPAHSSASWLRASRSAGRITEQQLWPRAGRYSLRLNKTKFTPSTP